MADFTHLDDQGNARMVDIAGKLPTRRSATATASVRMKPTTLSAIVSGDTKKGDVLAAARIAGIQASKKTPELIPLCHQIALTKCEVSFRPDPDGVRMHVSATAQATDRTGVEMEALTAVSVAALTLYDMVKSVDRGMVIEEIALQEKTGGKSGDYHRVD